MMTMDDDHMRARRVAYFTLVANLVLACGKLVAGVVGRSYALIADGVESVTDLFSGGIVLHGVTIASRPADAEHPYGHGRAEALAGGLVALIIIGAGIGIAGGAVYALMKGDHEPPRTFTLWVLLGVVVTKEVMFRVLSRVARETDSRAVLNSAWDQRKDVISSTAAAIGISIAVFGGKKYAAADEWAALVASAIILYNGIPLARETLLELMDTQPSHIVEQARAVAGTVEDVMDVEKVFARKSGLRYLVDMHIEVDPHMTVEHAHEIAHEVVERIQNQVPGVQDVLIHVEPHGQKRMPGPGST